MNSKQIKKKINLIIRDLENQRKIYHPTHFWLEVCNNFIKIFIKKGFVNFRRNKLATNYFVPMYNFLNEKKTNLKYSNFEKTSKKFQHYYKNLIYGKLEAFDDYKTFKAGDEQNKSIKLHKFTESKIGRPLEQFNFENKLFSRSSLNYLLGLVFLKKNIQKFKAKTFLEIGGGFGTLGEILYQSEIKGLKYINIDIPPISLVSEYYLTKNFGTKNVDSYFQNRKKNKIFIDKIKKKITCLSSWQIEKLLGKIDIFVNFISFQEMEPKVVRNYINHVIRLSPKFILLRNLREGKQIKSKFRNGVIKQVKKNDYIKFLKKKYKMINSNILPFGFKTYDNFHSELLIFKKKN